MPNKTNDEYKKHVSELNRRVTELEREIAYLRQSEERYRYFFENANDLIHSLDSRGRILYVNRLWRQTLGYSRNEAKNMTIFDIVDKSCQQKCRTIFHDLMKGEKLPPTETVFVTKKGSRISVEGRCSPRYENGIPHELFGIFRDITERKRLEDEKERLIAELKEAVGKVRTLEGFLPICASCKKIRDDKGYWNQIECYIRDNSLIQFSHGICPECMTKLYPDVKLNKQRTSKPGPDSS